jgi:ABC-type molybdenum transport system ATPase subunit/photorepair protein PhrA
MSPAASLTNATRSALGLMVEREERRVGSRDVAYEIVAQTVGASSSWIRKFLSRSTEVKEPRITLFLNIRSAYENVCARVEQEQVNELLKISKLKGELDAVTAGFDRMVAGETRAEAVGAATEREA